ncbi:hypothetical protein B1L11_43785 [Microbispora sp. GKU 823]|nr:hypothetical protein B1L11_43785 [Microbispora sp. GKU 823]
MRLDEEIKRLFAASGGTYGSPPDHQDLHAGGWTVSENTVAGRMAELGLAGRPPKKRRSLPQQGKRRAAPDLVGRTFTAVTPNVLWVGDGTMIDTDDGPLYPEGARRLRAPRVGDRARRHAEHSGHEEREQRGRQARSQAAEPGSPSGSRAHHTTGGITTGGVRRSARCSGCRCSRKCRRTSSGRMRPSPCTGCSRRTTR